MYLLSTEIGCEGNWEKNEQIGSCYQFNTQAALSWKEAYVSCHNQGADLLSINNASELTYLKGRFNLHVVEQIAEIVMLSVFYFRIQVCCFVYIFFYLLLGFKLQQ